MPKVIGVRFPSSGRIYYFDPLDFEIHVGDGVIVETARGQEYGFIAQEPVEVEDTAIVTPLKPILRLATEADTAMRDEYTSREEEAFAVCAKKIAEHQLDMKLVSVEYSFNGSKVVFYFTADGRVDFRELVRDLASHFRTRIELRQIGVRDEARMLGGLGPCGRPVCCKTFLDDFRPVSIKMAKEQNLSLSPTKISGLCGRLMCCLQYEQAAYDDMKTKMPRVGREVVTPDGTGTAIENNAITEKTRVRLILSDGSIDVREYHYTELAKPGEPVPARRVPAEASASDVPVKPTETVSGDASGERRPPVRRRTRPNRPAQAQGAEASASGETGSGEKEKREPRNPNRPHNSRGSRPQRNPAANADAAQKPKHPSPEQKPSEHTDAPEKNKSRRRYYRGGANHRRPGGNAPGRNGGAPKGDA